MCKFNHAVLRIIPGAPQSTIESAQPAMQVIRGAVRGQFIASRTDAELTVSNASGKSSNDGPEIVFAVFVGQKVVKSQHDVIDAAIPVRNV